MSRKPILRWVCHLGLLWSLLIAWSAAAQPSPNSPVLERIQSGIDELARGLQYLGQKAQDVLGSPWSTPGAQHTASRRHSEQVPVSTATTIAVSHVFGNIRITTWDDPVVSLDAEWTLGAQTQEAADALADALHVRMDNQTDMLYIQTQLPDAAASPALTAVNVTLTLKVPRSAGLITDNFWGDTYIQGAEGYVAVESQYGAVDFVDLKGPVTVRARGEFPLRAVGLHQGGSFFLHGTDAEFVNVAGTLQVNAFRGAVRLREIAADARCEIHAENAPVHLLLPPNTKPDLSAVVLYGKLVSTLPLLQNAVGQRIAARIADPDSTQSFAIDVAFADLNIEAPQPPANPASEKAADDGKQPVQDVLEITPPLDRIVPLLVDAAPGDIQIRATDDVRLRVGATRAAWVSAASQAPTALETLRVQVEPTAEAIKITTAVPANPSDYGMSHCRIHLTIDCPKTMPVQIRAADGATTADGLAAALTVEQALGPVTAQNIQAPVTVSTQRGDVRVASCLGPVDIQARYGLARVENVAEAIRIKGVQGKTLVDGAKGSLSIQQLGGEVRILALQPLGGNIEVNTENANVALLLGPEADASLELNTVNGTVSSGIPLEGRIERNAQSLRGTLSNGTYRIRLDVRNGDITLN
jgi:hypothetical protein